MRARKEQVFFGLGVSPGIGIGEVHERESGGVDVPEYAIPAKDVTKEHKRLQAAVSGARHQIERLRAKAKTLPATAAEEMDLLLDAYLQMLKDSRLVRGAKDRILTERVNAEAAVQGELTEISTTFSNMDDVYLAARLDDIREVAQRLIQNLVKAPRSSVSNVPKGSVIVAEELTPADTAQLDPSRIVGFATAHGGAEGHTAIMARALALPAVFGAPELLQEAKNKDKIIIDGDLGCIVINPKLSTLAAYERRKLETHQKNKQLSRIRNQPSVTPDGTTIDLQANMELPIQLGPIGQMGATGIGLLRSEFMFMNRPDLPSEDEQCRALTKIIKGMDGQPVTVRTLDIGGDKIATSLLDRFGDSVYSALGLRGIRLSLAHTEVFETQIKAILRASSAGPVRILLPMVSANSEIRKAREIVKRMARTLKRRKIPMATELPPIGVMIEVPAAALSADALAQTADFFAIGSNDLTMYTLAIDRSDKQVASLFNPLHPSVLRLIQFSLQAALRARIPVSICGEMAGDPNFTALLLGLGFRELSMTAASIPKVKQRIRNLDLLAAEARVRVIMDQVDSGRITMLLEDFNALA